MMGVSENKMELSIIFDLENSWAAFELWLVFKWFLCFASLLREQMELGV